MLMRMIKYAKVRGFPKYITKPTKFNFNEIVVFRSNNSKNLGKLFLFNDFQLPINTF